MLKDLFLVFETIDDSPALNINFNNKGRQIDRQIDRQIVTLQEREIESAEKALADFIFTCVTFFIYTPFSRNKEECSC